MSEKLYQGCEPRIIERVPIHLKMVLTIREAAEYSNIDEITPGAHQNSGE